MKLNIAETTDLTLFLERFTNKFLQYTGYHKTHVVLCYINNAILLTIQITKLTDLCREYNQLLVLTILILSITMTMTVKNFFIPLLHITTVHWEKGFTRE